MRVKHSSNFLLVSDSWYILLLYTCHLREIIAILDWRHEGVNLNTIIVIHTVIFIL